MPIDTVGVSGSSPVPPTITPLRADNPHQTFLLIAVEGNSCGSGQVIIISVAETVHAGVKMNAKSIRYAIPLFVMVSANTTAQGSGGQGNGQKPPDQPLQVPT